MRDRSESESDVNDNMSTTTSLLAERVVEDIGGPKRITGFGKCFKNCGVFCIDSCAADCSNGSIKVGYQE